jgi:outer membrane receptor protein involved in Fe transport
LVAEYLPDDAGKAHSFGIETSLKYLVLPYSSLFGTYAYINGKFNDKDEAGHRFRLTPKHSFSIGFDFSAVLRRGQLFYVRPAYSWKSKVYFEDDNDEGLTQESYGLLNCTAGFRFKPSKNGKTCMEIDLYGKNILNEKYIIDAGNSGNTIGFPTFIAGNRLYLVDK